METKHLLQQWHNFYAALLSLPWYIHFFIILTFVGSLLIQNFFPLPHNHWEIREVSLASNETERPNTVITESQITLPHAWNNSRQENFTQWYVTSFANPSYAAPSIFIDHVQQDISIWVNRTRLRLDQYGSHLKGARIWSKPVFAYIPESALNPEGLNRITIRITSDVRMFGTLGRLFAGPESELRSAWYWRYTLRNNLTAINTLGLLFLGLFVLIIAINRRSEHIYLMFSLACLTWSLHNFPHLYDPPKFLPNKIWDITSYLTLGWMVILLVLYDHRHINFSHARLEKFMLYFGVLAAIPLFILPLEWMHLYGIFFWYLGIVTFGGYAMIFLILKYAETGNRETLLVIIGGIAIFGLGFHDYLVNTDIIPRRQGFLIQYSGIPAMMIFSWFILHRFLNALKGYEKLTQELEKRVREKELELQENYKQLHSLEKQRILSDERERIMQDMHDGVGGQLVTTLIKLEKNIPSEEVADDIRDCLTDLRLVIDSLDPSADSLPVMLAMVRNRLSNKLQSAGINLVWRASATSTPADFGPGKSLHVMRIVQEAITNAIKHSGSRNITFTSSEMSNEFVSIAVSDEGGWKTAIETGGKGVINMKKRAAILGADLDITRSETGTVVSLRIPLKAVSTSADDH